VAVLLEALGRVTSSLIDAFTAQNELLMLGVPVTKAEDSRWKTEV
jgi:hypothetical protein